MEGKKIERSDIVDLSDYGREVAVFIAKSLAKRGVRAWQVTVFHFLIMIFCCFLVYEDTNTSLALASILLMLKNVFDAVDGSIARIQNRPSKTGRFLDSNLDFLGHFLLFLVIPFSSLPMKLAGFFSFVFQGSFYNYYFVLFRQKDKGDKTSRIEENGENEFPYDNPFIVKVLYYFYVVFYKWQDKILDFVEVRFLNCERAKPDSKFLAFVSIFGPGFQYLFIILFFTLGNTLIIPLFFLLPYNGLLLYGFYLRKRCKEGENE